MVSGSTGPRFFHQSMLSSILVILKYNICGSVFLFDRKNWKFSEIFWLFFGNFSFFRLISLDFFWTIFFYKFSLFLNFFFGVFWTFGLNIIVIWLNFFGVFWPFFGNFLVFWWIIFSGHKSSGHFFGNFWSNFLGNFCVHFYGNFFGNFYGNFFGNFFGNFCWEVFTFFEIFSIFFFWNWAQKKN